MKHCIRIEITLLALTVGIRIIINDTFCYGNLTLKNYT